MNLLRQPLPEESADQDAEERKEKADEYVDTLFTPFTDREREATDGLLPNLGQSLSLRHDFFSYTYCHLLRRKVIFGDDADTEDEDAETHDEYGEELPDNPLKRLQVKKDDDDPRIFYKTSHEQRKTVFIPVSFLVAVELMLIWFLVIETVTDDEIVESIKARPASIDIVITRFICGIFMHITLICEIKQGLDMMKFANNHHFLFRRWGVAYIVGFTQLSLVVMVELINVVILVTNNTIMDTLMNFLALVIIADFDDYYISTVKDQFISKLLEDGKFTWSPVDENGDKLQEENDKGEMVDVEVERSIETIL